MSGRAVPEVLGAADASSNTPAREHIIVTLDGQVIYRKIKINVQMR